MEIPTNTYHFMLWIYKHTTHIQNNVKHYKGVMYFIDRKTSSGGNEGGLDDL